MSHYTVAVVVGKHVGHSELMHAVEEALAPYDENLVTEPRIIKLKSQIISECISKQENNLILSEELVKIGEDEFKEKYGDWELRVIKEFIETDGKNKSDIELYNDFKDRGYDDDDFDEEGNLLSTYNEDSKWDWWQVGGRWQGLLFVKEGSPGLVGETGFMDSGMEKRDVPGYFQADGAKVKDINFDIFDKSEREETKNYYESEFAFQNKFGTFENFAEAFKYKITYAILDSRNNQWIEPGKMGWWAQTDETKESKAEYIAFCKEFYTTLDPEDWVVIVDCHI